MSKNNIYFRPGSDSCLLSRSLDRLIIRNRPIVVLCIGTDRCSGDSLGPLVGYKLERIKLNDAVVFGTLSNPVHALNICDTIDNIYTTFDNPFVIAIDASLGKVENIGCVTLGIGPLVPGLGVGKSLPVIGDIHITGIVNHRNGPDAAILQTTRLNTVMEMADFIVNGIQASLNMYNIHLSICG